MSQLIDALVAMDAPSHIAAAFEVLQFQNALTGRLAALGDLEQHKFIEWCDVRQVTLMLSHVCGGQLPAWADGQVRHKATRYELRFERLKRQLFEIVEALDAAGLEFVMLKGLSHAPALTPDARLRGQGDIDLWLIGSSVYKARDILRGLGYVAVLDSKSRHLAPMALPSNWEWQGDLFDPEMPISVELHYELWSEQTEYIAVPQLQQFWNRRKLREFDGYQINVLCDEDLLGFAALHLMLHLLHGELPLQRAWEIARFLDAHASDEFFWRSWQSSHPEALRQLETSIFFLVTRWFDCRSRRELETDVDALPKMVKLWLEKSSLALLKREWEPNKLEIWLHLALASTRKAKARLFLRRLIPISLPSFADRGESTTSQTAKLLKFFRQRRLIAARLVRHLVTFFPTLFDGLRWFLLRRP